MAASGPQSKRGHGRHTLRTTARADYAVRASLSQVRARGLARSADRRRSRVDALEPAALERLRCTGNGLRPRSDDSATTFRRPRRRRVPARLLNAPPARSARCARSCRPRSTEQFFESPRHEPDRYGLPAGTCSTTRSSRSSTSRTRRRTRRGCAARSARRPGCVRIVTGQAAIQHDLDPVFQSDLRHGEFAIAIPAALARPRCSCSDCQRSSRCRSCSQVRRSRRRSDSSSPSRTSR